MEGLSICVQCGCHLESSFRFCPKCGMKLTREAHAGENSQHRTQTTTSVSGTRRISAITPLPSTSCVPRLATVQTKLKLPGFESYKASKEHERRGFNVRGKDKKKRRVETQMVVIHVGVMGDDGKPKRCETLPVSVSTSATPKDIVEAAVAKHAAFNKRFNGNSTYRLVFRDGDKVSFIPGTIPAEPFTLLRYKDASGFGYSKITFYLSVRDVIADLKNVIESDSSSDTDDTFTSVASIPAFGQSQVREAQNDGKRENRKPEKVSQVFMSVDCVTQESSQVSLMINCPTCGLRFAVSEIEEHADLCADSVVVLPDPVPHEIATDQTSNDQGRTFVLYQLE